MVKLWYVRVNPLTHIPCRTDTFDLHRALPNSFKDTMRLNPRAVIVVPLGTQFVLFSISGLCIVHPAASLYLNQAQCLEVFQYTIIL